MGDCTVLETSERYILHRANSGAMRFQVKCANNNIRPVFRFSSKRDPQKLLYKVTLGSVSEISNISHKDEEDTTHSLSNVNFDEFVEFWITWYNKKIQMGLPSEEKPFLVHNYQNDEVIGYIQFDTLSRNATVEWIFEASPVILKPLPSTIFDGELTWSRMTDNRLCPNALIGGFEKEPTYVARFYIHGSLIPGKYVPSCGMAFVPWGHREHGSRDFEVLCGHNAKWVKTKGNHIPQDAFVAGYSEVRREPLYIGRAMHDGCLVIGKVHVLYQACYLPYYGKEIEVSSYEILTVPRRTYSHDAY